jgi:O-antigen/teichoic acid export membrane protein
MLKHKILSRIRNQQFKDFIVYGFGQAVNLISPLLVMPYIVFICGEEGLGKVGVGFSFALIAIVLVDYGSYINGTKAISLNTTNQIVLEEKFTTIYFAKFILLLIVLACCCLLILGIPFFRKDYLQLLFSLLIVVGQFINPTWFLQGVQNFKWISAINIVSKVIYVCCVFLFIHKAEDYIYVNAFLGIGSIIASLISFIYLYYHYSFSFQKTSFVDAFQLIKEEFSLTISQLFFSFYQYAPIMLISYVGGDFMAGQYRIIDQVVMIFRTYFQMFFNFIYADICLKIYQNSKLGITNWKIKNGYNYLIVVFIIVLFYFNATTILLFFKVNSSDVHKLAPLFRIGLFLPLFIGISFSVKQLIFAFDKNKLYIKTTIFSSVLSLILMFFLLTTLGLKGAFISTILIEIFVIVVYLLILKKHLFKTKLHS